MHCFRPCLFLSIVYDGYTHLGIIQYNKVHAVM